MFNHKVAEAIIEKIGGLDAFAKLYADSIIAATPSDRVHLMDRVVDNLKRTGLAREE